MQSLMRIPSAVSCIWNNRLSTVRYFCVSNKLNNRREINESVQNKFKKIDNIPDTYKLIYRAPIKNYIKISYFTGFTSIVVMTPFLASVLYQNELSHFPYVWRDMEVIQNAYEFYGLIAALGLMIFQIVSLVFKYPFRIYLDNKSKHYIAVYQDILPWINKKEEFTAGEIRKAKKGLMPWTDDLYTFRNREAILLEDYFTRPLDFQDMFQAENQKKNTKEKDKKEI